MALLRISRGLTDCHIEYSFNGSDGSQFNAPTVVQGLVQWFSLYSRRPEQERIELPPTNLELKLEGNFFPGEKALIQGIVGLYNDRALAYRSAEKLITAPLSADTIRA